MAADAAPVAENAPAALAAFPRQKAMLAHAADLRRLILSFHKFSSVAPGQFRPNDIWFGNTPKFGTREHTSEKLSVKQGASAVLAQFEAIKRRKPRSKPPKANKPSAIGSGTVEGENTMSSISQ